MYLNVANLSLVIALCFCNELICTAFITLNALPIWPNIKPICLFEILVLDVCSALVKDLRSSWKYLYSLFFIIGSCYLNMLQVIHIYILLMNIYHIYHSNIDVRTTDLNIALSSGNVDVDDDPSMSK
jgi:hypothetical protein